jgi:hypothetical protein
MLVSNQGIKMGRPKEMKDGVRLAVFMPKSQAERVKYMAISMSKQEGRQITVSEAIRMAIETAYPVPKGQAELFD